MKFRYIKSILSAASLLLAVSVTSCIGDLDATPIDPNIVMTFDQASVFNKIYGTLGLTGQKGPTEAVTWTTSTKVLPLSTV